MRKIVTVTERFDLTLFELGAVFIDLVADGLLADVEIFRKGFVGVPVQRHQTTKQCFVHTLTLFPDLPSSVQGGHPLQTGKPPFRLLFISSCIKISFKDFSFCHRS